MLSSRKVFERRLHRLPTQTTHVLRNERHHAVDHDVSAAPVSLLLHACAESPDWSCRSAQLPNIPA